MQKVRTLIRKIIFFNLSILFKWKITRQLMNSIYNNLSWFNKRVFTNHIKNPGLSFTWKIKLLNGVKMINFINKNDKYQFVLGLEYHNISPQICILENEINTCLSKEQMCFDIGANQGMRSYTFLSTSRKTFMFEPNPYLNELNINRCRLNKFSNYKIEPICLSNKNGSEKFYFSNDPSMSSLERDFAERRGVLKAEDVLTKTLDSYIDENNLNVMHPYIKIDTEGHEMYVIEGAENTILRLKPTFLIEIFDKQKVKTLFMKFSKLNYEVFGVNFGDSNILTKINKQEQLDSYSPSDYLFVYQKEVIEGLKKYI